MRHVFKTLAVTAAVLIATPAMASPIVVDFSRDYYGNAIRAGQIIDDEFAPWFTVNVDNQGGGPDLGVAFDSANPTGGDTDLRTPSTSHRGNAWNQSLGNLLIIQENGRRSSTKPGFINTAPDDEAGGGDIWFDFAFGITSFGFHLVDMETAEASSSYVQLFNGGSSIGSATFTQLDQYYDPSLHFGDNSINRITPFDLTSLGLGEADSVRIHFSGSGAVDNISFTQGVVPEPATMTLLGMGLGGLAVARRRRNAKQK